MLLIANLTRPAHAEDRLAAAVHEVTTEAEALASESMLPVRSDDPAKNLDPGPEAPLVAAKKPELFNKLKEYGGQYELISRDPNTPCYTMLRKPLDDVRLNVSVEQKDDEYGAKAGNVKVELQQYWDNSSKWYRIFDRADFSNVNERRTSSRVGLLKITHQSTFDDKKETLLHESSISQLLQGSETAHQLIEFSKDKSEFTYTYSYQSTGHKKEVSCKAVFRKKS